LQVNPVLLDLTTQLDKTQRLLRQLLEAKSATRSEQLSADQLRLFAQELNVAEDTRPESAIETQEDDDLPPGASEEKYESRPRGRRPLRPHLKRKRIEHDLTEEDKRCGSCDEDLRPIGEETSERYEPFLFRGSVLHGLGFRPGPPVHGSLDHSDACREPSRGRPRPESTQGISTTGSILRYSQPRRVLMPHKKVRRHNPRRRV
jgi:hypothetical protein